MHIKLIAILQGSFSHRNIGLYSLLWWIVYWFSVYSFHFHSFSWILFLSCSLYGKFNVCCLTWVGRRDHAFLDLMAFSTKSPSARLPAVLASCSKVTRRLPLLKKCGVSNNNLPKYLYVSLYIHITFYYHLGITSKQVT